MQRNALDKPKKCDIIKKASGSRPNYEKISSKNAFQCAIVENPVESVNNAKGGGKTCG
jgi:hypothetical protein